MGKTKLKIRKKSNKRLSMVLLILVISIGFSYLAYYNKAYVELFVKEVLYYPTKYFVEDSEVLGNIFNDELANENKELRELLKLEESISDFNYVNATVITRNTSYFFSVFTINKGSSSGVKKDMAVVTSGGLVGVVDSVTKNTSNIRMITSSDTRNKVSVKISSSKNTINSIMSVDENRQMVALGIDKNIDIKKGDIVTTSGLSDVFPPGIIIGYVEKVVNDDYRTSKKVYIKLSSNVQDIRYVAVLKRGVYD